MRARGNDLENCAKRKRRRPEGGMMAVVKEMEVEKKEKEWRVRKVVVW